MNIRNFWKRNIVSLLLATYVFLCMFVQFSGHGFSADCTRELALRFSNDTELLFRFQWATDSKLGFKDGILWGPFLGLVVAAFTFMVTRYSLKKKKTFPEKTSFEMPMLLILLAYLSTFIVASLIVNPYFIHAPTELFFAIVFGVISSWIGVYSAGRIKAKNRRMDFTLNYKFQIKRLEWEYEKLKETLNLQSAACVSLLAGVVVVLMYQSFYATPPEIYSTTLYKMTLIPTLLSVVLILVGYVIGILLPLVLEAEDVINAVREYEVWLARKRKESSRAHLL